MKNFRYVFFFAAIISVAACTNPTDNDHKIDSTVNTPPVPRVKGPAFSCDTAFNFVKTQVDFGPRVPETKAHTECGDFIIAKLKSYGITPLIQKGNATFYNGTPIHLLNIFAQYHPERKERILLLAHWDSRPWADEDTVRRDEPIDGADDGASGVAVLLEMARVLQQKDPNIGVDLFFSDAEDAGSNGDASGRSWCLGTQYWATNMVPAGYSASFGILLDMVGAKGAMFPREGTSVYYASSVVEKVWGAAAALGYGDYFVNDVTGETTDDHAFVNQMARIPCIDIVHYDMQKRKYGYFHHTHADNMSIMDCSTLQMVGNVLVDVIYNEVPK
jgi:glutaminyl-peptide cyclotransferase